MEKGLNILTLVLLLLLTVLFLSGCASIPFPSGIPIPNPLLLLGL